MNEDPGGRPDNLSIHNGGRENDQPSSISGNWIDRMVSRIKKNFSLCERGEVFAYNPCLLRKSLGAFCIAEFHCQE